MKRLIRLRQASLALLGAALLLNSTMSSASPTSGAVAGGFLREGVGARALAMGGAYTALAQGGVSVFWNPAGLVGSRFTEAELYYEVLPDGSALQFGGLSLPLGHRWGCGLGVVNLGSGSIPRYDATNQSLGDYRVIETGGLVSLGRTWGHRGSLGLSGTYVNKDLGDRGRAGWGVDGGAQVRWRHGVKLGIYLRHLVAPSYRFSSERETLPQEFSLGAAWVPPSWGWVFSVDALRTLRKDQDINIRAGAEWRPLSQLALRGGWDKDHVTTGMGFRKRSWGLDYAIGFPDYGLRHQLSLWSKWGSRP